MNNELQINYFLRLVEFWRRLNTPEQAIFRSLIKMSDLYYPDEMDKSEYISRLAPILKFRREIRSEEDKEGQWLDSVTIAACAGLLDKGLVWLDQNHYQINGIIFRLEEYPLPCIDLTEDVSGAEE